VHTSSEAELLPSSFTLVFFSSSASSSDHDISTIEINTEPLEPQSLIEISLAINSMSRVNM
jgi:hypothetical protein